MGEIENLLEFSTLEEMKNQIHDIIGNVGLFNTVILHMFC